MKQQLLVILHNLLMNIVTEIKGACLLEKILIIALFLVPVPFTLEGYFALRVLIKKFANKKFRSKEA